MPKDNYFTKLLVKYCHELVLHNSQKETLNGLRTKFWIPKARNYIRKILFKCLLCKRHEGQPFTYPSPPDLPRSRLSDAYPFTYTGLDYAGPLYVKSIYGRSDMYKAWIFLFTCACTRGLFLDLVPDYTSASCIRGLRRFFSKRGVPQQIISDNGSQFTATETQSLASSKSIKWKFNLAAAPWWGGIFERLVFFIIINESILAYPYKNIQLFVQKK